jgi:hypothetical protein
MDFQISRFYRISPCQLGIEKKDICRIGIEMDSLLYLILYYVIFRNIGKTDKEE